MSTPVNTNTAASGATNVTVATKTVSGEEFQKVMVANPTTGVELLPATETTLATLSGKLPNLINGSQPVAVNDASGAAIGSLGSGTGALGILSAVGATEFFFSTANSSTSQLAASAIFNGTIESIVNAQAFSIIMTSDQPGTLTVTEYVDAAGLRPLPSKSFNITAGAGFSRCFTANGNYFRLTFQNTGASTTTTLNINTAFGTLPAVTASGNAPVALNEVNGAALSLGSKAASASIPVTLASDQAAIPITGPMIIVEQTVQDLTAVSQTAICQIEPGGFYTLAVSMPNTTVATVSLASCTTAVGSRTIAYTGTAPSVGQLIAGTGIPNGAYVSGGIVASTSFDISVPATAAGTVTLTTTGGSFGVQVTSSPDGSSYGSAMTVYPMTVLTANTPTSTVQTIGLYRINAGSADKYLKATLTALTSIPTVRARFGALNINGASIKLPFISGLTAAIPTGICAIPPIDTSLLCEINVDLFAFAGTSQVLTWQQTGDETLANAQGWSHTTGGAAQNSAALTATAAGNYRLSVGPGIFRANLTHSAITSMTITQVQARVGVQPTIQAVHITTNNTPVNISQDGGQTPIVMQPNGSTNRARTVGLAGPTSNTDYSAQAWSAASGSGAVIAEVNGLGTGAAFDVNLTAWTAGSSTGLDVYLQESPDNGTTFYDIWQCEALTAVSRARIPALPIGGRRRMRWVNRGGAATTATVTVTAMEVSGLPTKQVQWFDRTASVTSGTAAVGNGAAYDIAGCKAFNFAIDTGTATAPASFKVQMSTDGVRWYDASAAISCPASATTAIPLTAGVYGRFARFVCTAGGTTALVTAGHIYGTN